MHIPILFFLLGLLLLIAGGNWFVKSAVGIAHRFHVPELLIGATIVSIGTTLPEVMVSATSALAGHGELAYGNAIGSIICNTALIAAVTLAVRPQNTDPDTLKIPVIFFFSAALFFSCTAFISGRFTRFHGLLLLSVFIMYLIYTLMQMNRPVYDQYGFEKEAPVKEITDTTPLSRYIIQLISGAVAIAYGADLIVDTGTEIATVIGIPESVIGLTFVAIGTSLPELVTAITALVKGHSALSLGNIIGANLLNLVWVSGIAIVLNPFSIPRNSTLAGYNTSLILELPLMLIAMLILTIPTLIWGKASRIQGILLLILYAGFCAVQFMI